MGITSDLIYIVFAAIVGGWLAHILRQPVIVGYIFAGIAIGPHSLPSLVQNIVEIERLAEIGIALLLFTIGLEFSLGELKRHFSITILGTSLQIFICTLGCSVIASSLGLGWSDSIWVGSAFALSSTMVVIKTLSMLQSLETTHGKVMLAMLIAQDLAVIPIVMLLPAVTGMDSNSQQVFLALLKSSLFLMIMYISGTLIVPKLFSAIARFGSRELFFASTLGLVFLAGLLADLGGMSFALGAFVAGLLLSQTDFNYQALIEVANLRDLFGLLFFVSVGMLFDPKYFVENIDAIGVLVVCVVTFKALVTGLLVKVFGYRGKTPWKVGFGLSQVGEFAFLISAIGQSKGLLSQEGFSLVIAVAVISMAGTPFLFSLGSLIARNRRRDPSLEKVENLGAEYPDQDHVVIIGGGILGTYVATALEGLRQPYIIIENEYKIVTRLRDLGIEVLFGDGLKSIVLKTARIASAKLVVIATTDNKILPELIKEIRAINSEVRIVLRLADIEEAPEIPLKDIYEVVTPQLEAGLEMVRQSLLALGKPLHEVTELADKLRNEKGLSFNQQWSL